MVVIASLNREGQTGLEVKRVERRGSDERGCKTCNMKNNDHGSSF